MNKFVRRIFTSAFTFVLVSSFFLTLSARNVQAKEPFRITMNDWVGFGPLFLAKDKGFFGDLPVDLNFIMLEGDRRAALYSGRVEMVCDTIDIFENNRTTADYTGKIVFAIDESFGGDGIVAKQEIQTINDLRGKTAASEPGMPSHFVLQVALRKHGMTLKDMKMQDMASADGVSAFISGRVDAAGAYEPYTTMAIQKRKGAHLLVSSRDFPGLITDVAIVSNEMLQNRREDVRQVYAGWTKAIDYFKINRKEAVAVMAPHFKLSPEEFEKTISGLRYYGEERNLALFGTRGKPGPIFKTFRMIGNVLRANQLTSALAAPASKIDPNIILLQIR